jgi:hypothetical protein
MITAPFPASEVSESPTKLVAIITAFTSDPQGKLKGAD